jgi:DNA-binding NarL/FixJ family response regulator
MELDRERIRVVIVDDSEHLCGAFARLCARTPDLELAAGVQSADAVLAAVDAAAPSVVVLDLSIAGLEPSGLVRSLASRAPPVRVLVYSGHHDRAIVERVRDAGASGFVGKHEDPQRLLAAIRRLAAGCTDFPE